MKFFILSFLSILFIHSALADMKIGDELRTVNDINIMTNYWNRFTYKDSEAVCTSIILNNKTKFSAADENVVIEAKSVFKLVRVESGADKFLGYPYPGYTKLTLISESEKFSFEITCHTKKKYIFQKSAASHALGSEKVLEFFSKHIN